MWCYSSATLAWQASAQVTTTSSSVSSTTTSTYPPGLTSGQPCPDYLACQQVIARDVSRMRSEVLTALFLLVLLAAAALIVLVVG
jgi:hypothetical protein